MIISGQWRLGQIVRDPEVVVCDDLGKDSPWDWSDDAMTIADIHDIVKRITARALVVAAKRKRLSEKKAEYRRRRR